MEQLKQRFSRNSPRNSFLNDRHEDAQESLLADDVDAFRQSKHDSDITLRLKLSDSTNFSEDAVEPESFENGAGNADDSIFSDVEPPHKGQTVFEVVSTEKVKEGRASYVLYKILLTRSGVVDESPCIIQRRYSDFQTLYSGLKKHYPHSMVQVSFPKKHLTGNFTPETIARRSRSFEQLLSHLYSIDTIRFSYLFKEFFYAQDLEDAYNLLSEGSYFKAVSLFLKIIPAQERIMGEYSEDVGATLCSVTVCYLKLDEKDLSLKYGLSGLKCLRASEDSQLYISLLNSCVYLCWVLHKDKQNLEAKLSELVPKEKNIPDLLNVILEQRKMSQESK